MTTAHRRTLVTLVALVGLSCGVQAWLISRAVMPARDAAGFVRYAQAVDRQGLLPTLRHERQQPLFPLVVWLVHRVGEAVGGPQAASWAICAQLAAAMTLVLAVVPVYFIALALVGPRGAVAGAVLFATLPEVARLGADGISDSTHLLLFAMAFGALTAYFRGARASNKGEGTATKPGGCSRRDRSRRDRSPGDKLSYGGLLFMLLAGLATAAAALTRAEAIVLPAALTVSLVGFQFQPRRRQSWPQVAAAVGCFVLGFATLFGLYLAAAGSLTPRAAVARAMGRFQPHGPPAPEPRPAIAAGDAVWHLDDGRRMSFADKEPSPSSRRRGLVPALGMLADRMTTAFAYWAGAFALFGVWRLSKTLPRRVDRFVQIFFVLYCLAVVRFVSAEGYLTTRHLLPLVVTTVGCAGYGLVEAAQWGVATMVGKQATGKLRAATAWVAVVLAAVACLAVRIEPLHADWRGHRHAAEWLAQCADAPGPVLDTQGLAGLCSGGRPVYGRNDIWAAFCDPRLAYVMLERREIESPSARGRTLATLLAAAAEPAATFSPNAPAGDCPNFRLSKNGTVPFDFDARDVLVYRWHSRRYLDWIAASGPQQHRKSDTPLPDNLHISRSRRNPMWGHLSVPVPFSP